MTSSFLDALGTQADELLAAGTPRRFAVGAILIREGQPLSSILLVRSGRVKVTTLSADGREAVLSISGPGEVLGELSALDEQPPSATLVAMEPVETIAVSVGAFRTFLTEHPTAMLAVLRTITGRLREGDRKRLEFAVTDTLGRVCSRLVELAHKHGVPHGDSVRITLPLSQEELAAWTGSSREAVAKSLRTLRERGYIETHRRSITVVNLGGLQKIR
jgi:CRP-like cAMP-binding protein